jgi:peptidyl-prolyl cis-trans isomerase A (cyclophilin A)
MNRVTSLCAILIAASPLAWAEEVQPADGPIPIADAVKGLKGKGELTAKIEVETDTVKGVFTCKLYEDKTPRTVANFVGLARGLQPWKDPKSGQWTKRPLYDGTTFHRVIPDFMIQGGDPLGTGTGTPGYEFDDEIVSGIGFDRGGLLAMANRGKNPSTGHGTNGSQFFITAKDASWLNGRHTIFGECEPLKLEHDVAAVATGPMNRPSTPVTIKKLTIQRGAGEAGTAKKSKKH